MTSAFTNLIASLNANPDAYLRFYSLSSFKTGTAMAHPARTGDRNPVGFCRHSNSILWHRYTIVGCDWTIKTEKELRAALESIAGIVFWRYEEKIDETGIVTFAVMVSAVPPLCILLFAIEMFQAKLNPG